ncbi:hypothetical protein OEZ86_004336 [Tetradesmus obliquus]|nr:hypothetical protein OEZ86_004336 [Tetradesmus obliquus]
MLSEDYFAQHIVVGHDSNVQRPQGATTDHAVKDQLTNSVYRCEKRRLVRLTDFHPVYQSEAFFYKHLLCSKPWHSEEDMRPRNGSWFNECVRQGVVSSLADVDKAIDDYASSHMHDTVVTEQLRDLFKQKQDLSFLWGTVSAPSSQDADVQQELVDAFYRLRDMMSWTDNMHEQDIGAGKGDNGAFILASSSYKHRNGLQQQRSGLAELCSFEDNQHQVDLFKAAAGRGKCSCPDFNYIPDLDAFAGLDPVVFDIGCNKGYDTALVFEAFAAQEEFSRKVLGDFYETNSELKAIINKGVADMPTDCGELCMLPLKKDSTAPPNSTKVAVTTVDVMMEQLGLKRLFLLKIDTEGFDVLVLQGARKALASHKVDILQFEYHGIGVWGTSPEFTLKAVVKDLELLGYICYFEGKLLTRLTGCWSDAFEEWSCKKLVQTKGREELLSRGYIKEHVFGALKSLAYKQPFATKASAGEAAFKALDKVVIPHHASNIKGQWAAAAKDAAAKEFPYPGDAAAAAGASPEALKAGLQQWRDELLEDNTWLGTNTNLLGTPAWGRILVACHNKMSTDHKVEHFGSGGVATTTYEKGITFQVKRYIRGDKGGLAGAVNLPQQHLQQHTEYVEMLRLLRTIIAAGDCMLGADGTVEIRATAADVHAANRAAAKGLEGLDDNDKRYRDSRNFL